MTANAPTKNRKPIQIEVTCVETESDILYALCDDGSIWLTIIQGGMQEGTEQWRRLPAIPQTGEDDAD